MATVNLNKAAYEVLKAEAGREMTNSIGERYSLRGSEAENDHEQIILACADVLGALGPFAPDETMSVEFSEEALAWMKKARKETKEHLGYLDNVEEGGLDYIARETYLARVLDRVVEANAEAVTA